MFGKNIDSKKLRPAVLFTTGLFVALCIIFFLPVSIPFKIGFPLTLLWIASLWLLPIPMSFAMLFSAFGDYWGAAGSFILQMAFFALAHICIIVFMVERYFRKVEPDRKLTAKAKGYMAMILFCIILLLVVVFLRIVPKTPEGVIRIGVILYAIIISTMLGTSLLQRSSLYALGAVLFVFSDFILAWNKFVEPVPCRNYLVLVPYFLAQWLLWVRSTPYRVKTSLRLARF